MTQDVKTHHGLGRPERQVCPVLVGCCHPSFPTRNGEPFVSVVPVVVGLRRGNSLPLKTAIEKIHPVVSHDRGDISLTETDMS